MLNGITFGCVGNGTSVEYVQVHNNADDCVEFFGGTVDVKRLICTGAGDDNLDIDWGYQGRLQYVIVQQSNDTGDHIVESDNTKSNADVGYLTEPRSNPVVSNFTFISRGHDEIFKLKEGVSGQYYNGVAAVLNAASGLTKGCIETTYTETTIQDGASTPNFSFNSVAFDCPTSGSPGSSTMVKIGEESGSATVSDVETIVKAGSNNLYGASSGGGSYANSLSGVVNGSAETAATVTAIPDALNTDGFFETPTYIGAVSGASDTWYKYGQYLDQ